MTATYDRSKIHSVSSLKESLCLRRYWEKYVNKRAGKDTEALKIGEAAHLCLKDFLHPDNWDIEGMCHDLIDFRSALDFLNDCAVWGQEETFYLDASGHYLPIQERHEIPQGAAFAGTIDLIYQDDTGNLCVLDWKTTANPKTMTPDDFQLRVYGFAALQMFPQFDCVNLQKWFLRFEDGKRSKTVHRDELFAAWDECVEKAARIDAAHESGNWPTTINEHCGWCDYRDECPDWTTALDRPLSFTLTTPQEALQAARTIRLVKQRLAELERDDGPLRSWCKANGGIFDPDTGETLNFYKSSKPEVDNLQAIRILRGAGISAETILTAAKLTKTALDDLIGDATAPRSQERKVLKEQIGLAITRTPTRKFEWRK